MKIKYKFINDILKPWDELNELLSLPYCVEPSLSTITKMATDIAISISHFAENSEIKKREQVGKECLNNQLMIDMADMAKHSKLRKPERENKINVASLFEYIEPSKFKFFRNKIIIEHNTYGKSDFMETSLKAIFYWAPLLNLDVKRKLIIKDNNVSEKATLIFNPKYCVHAEKATYNFLKKNEFGVLVDFDPPRFYIEIIDLDGKVKAFADIVTR
jgi:hypothetical protein